MKKAFIHIGSGKTGTSSIQSALAKIPSSREAPFSYPLIHGNGHQSIEVLFKDYKRISRGLKTKFERSGGYEEFKDGFEKSLGSYAQKSDLLLSSEFMFNFNLDEVFRLRSYLEEKGFDTFKVLVYLRLPSSYYMSYVQQKVKAAYSIPSPYKFKLGYAKAISNWHEVFGESVCIREFDRRKMVKGDVLEDFSFVLNDFFSGKVSLKANASNESVSSEGMVVLQEFRRMFFQNREDRFAKESTFLLKNIQRIEQEHAGTPPKLKKEYEKAIIKNNLDDMYMVNSFGVFEDFPIDEISNDADFCSANGDFLGDVKNLLNSFDESHYKYILHRLIYDSLA